MKDKQLYLIKNSKPTNLLKYILINIDFQIIVFPVSRYLVISIW